MEKLFIDLDGANVGFQHWHPMPVTGNGDCLAGQGEMGGVWEWTSSTLQKHEGFEPMSLYPGYTGTFNSYPRGSERCSNVDSLQRTSLTRSTTSCWEDLGRHILV